MLKYIQGPFDSEPEIDETKFGIYQIPIDLAGRRTFPPQGRDIDKVIGMILENELELPTFFDINSIKATELFHPDFIKEEFEKPMYPILTGAPSLFAYCLDEELSGFIHKGVTDFYELGEISCLRLNKGNSTIPLIKLWQISEVRQGLATADDPNFIRKSPWVVPNARRKDTLDADLKNCVTIEELHLLPEDEKRNGIKVIDKKTSKYYIPFDKGGEQDTKSGELLAITKKVDYWIDWSESSVNLLKTRNKLPPGSNKKPRFQNADRYFHKGIACSVTGLYAPTFWLSFGGIFGHKANLILPFEEKLVKYLTLYLNSTFIRYVAKNFIGNTVDFSTDYFRHLPIVAPTREQFESAEILFDELYERIINKNILYSETKEKIDNFVSDELLKLTSDEKSEISTWFKRRYHLFGRSLKEI